MAYKVKIMPRAQADLDRLCAWVTNRSPLQGLDWFEGMVDAVESLTEHPNRCALAPEFHSQGIRHLLYGRGLNIYRILFRVQDEVVEVLTVRHGARKPLKG
jgi:plasmid stabilization system protein ParE